MAMMTGAWTPEATPKISEAATATAYSFSIASGRERLCGRMRVGKGFSLSFFFGTNGVFSLGRSGLREAKRGALYVMSAF
jgi:hypothetical protein